MDSRVPDAMQIDEGKTLWVTRFFVIGRWTSPLAKSAKDPLCEHTEDNAAGEEDARWSQHKSMTHI